MRTTFLSGLEKTKENLQLEISTVLRRLGLYKNLAHVVTVGSVGVAVVTHFLFFRSI